MIRTVVSGACGRMGAAIAKRVIEDAGMELAGALEREGHPMLGEKIGGAEITSGLCGAGAWDVLVEFASPESALSHLPLAADAGKQVVVGATGFSAAELEELKKFAGKTAVLFSPNMSVGVSLLLKIAAEAAKALGPGFDMEIIEAHHAGKKDAPSGTAARIAEVLASARGLNIAEKGVCGRSGMRERTPGEIGVHAVRGGTITGEHTVLFAGESERLELTHRAESRDIFVSGTLRAVRFISGKGPGFYSMEDVIEDLRQS